MKPAEIEALESFVRKMNCEAIGLHAVGRMAQKNVNAREIGNALRYGQAIELHNESGEWRVLLRHESGRPRVAVCVVFAIERGEVVTVWKNRGDDKHSTLDLSAYKFGFNVCAVLQTNLSIGA
jgi:hypothetical protein